MSASPSGRRQGAIADVVDRLLTRDEWYVLGELIEKVGADPVDTMQAIDDLMKRGAVLRVRAPCGDPQLFWRGAAGDPSTKRLLDEGTVNMWDMPFELKKSFIEKHEEMHARRLINHGLWRLVEVAMTVEEALAKTGLHTEHPRPSDGFPFPCVWRANEPAVAETHFSVDVTFTETVPTDAVQLYRKTYDDNHKQLTLNGSNTKLKIRKNFTSLDTIAGRAKVDRWSKQLSYCPSRSELLENARRALIEFASRQNEAEPFMPVRCGFSLLSGTWYGSGE